MDLSYCFLYGYKYYVIFMEYFTRYMWFSYFQHKSNVLDIFIHFKALIEKHFQSLIITLYTNNGSEYILLCSFLATNGISHLITPPPSFKQDGIFRCRYRHIVETNLTLLHHAHMPLTFWLHVFSILVYLTNHMPKVDLSMQSSFEKLFKRPPNNTKLKVFGCLYYPWIQPYRSYKFALRSFPCIFLGYSFI